MDTWLTAPTGMPWEHFLQVHLQLTDESPPILLVIIQLLG